MFSFIYDFYVLKCELSMTDCLCLSFSIAKNILKIDQNAKYRQKIGGKRIIMALLRYYSLFF